MVQGGQRPEHHPGQAHDLTPHAGTAPPPRLLGLDHVQLAMPGGEEAERAAERFYAGVLGLERVPKPPEMAVRGGCWFEGPSVRIHLGVEEPHPPTRAHPALLVDDLAALGARLRAAGFAPTHDDLLPGFDRFHVQDPFGNRLELLQARPEFPPR